MAYLKYLIRPLQHMLEVSSPALNQPFPMASWPTQNVKLAQKSVQKRNGYILDRNLGNNVNVQRIIFFKPSGTTAYTVYLTNTDACKRESSGTWSYITETYTTGTISSISGATVTGSSTGWKTGSGNPEAGDFFIMESDLDSTNEPDSDWAEIDSVDSDTQITLVDNYKGATNSGNYIIRKIYSVPQNERWSYTMVNDKLCFTNGNVNVQYWTGSGNAQDLDSTNAVKARYCIEYADRLVLADLYISGTREPYTIKWSKNGDPTDWTDSTAGSADLIETDSVIMGLGKSGGDLVVFKDNSFILGNRTGKDTAPIKFSRERRGIGCVAPYSIVDVLGTNAFLGRSDFYILDGGSPVPIGEPIRYKFFDLIDPLEIKKVYGYTNSLEKEVRWFMTDINNNRRCFVWNWQYKEWYHYVYNDTFSCGGKGEA